MDHSDPHSNSSENTESNSTSSSTDSNTNPSSNTSSQSFTETTNTSTESNNSSNTNSSNNSSNTNSSNNSSNTNSSNNSSNTNTSNNSSNTNTSNNSSNTNTSNNSSNTNSSNNSSNTNSSNNSSNTNSSNNSSNTNSSNNSTNTNSSNNSTNTNTSSPFIYVNETINGIGYQVTNNQQSIPDVSVTTTSTFTTSDPSAAPQINQNLNEIVNEYDNTTVPVTESIVTEIRHYAAQIKCDDFHGKGTIDDYAALFQAASKIANESKQMQLDIDVDGFNEFGQAADDLSALFINFTQKLQSVNIIDDTAFLRAVLNALKKIYNLSEVFGRFKKTILITSEIKIPKTAHDTKEILVSVMSEVNCSLNYINNFVNPDPNLVEAQLSDADKNIINKAVVTIENWRVLCDQGVSIAMTTNTDMEYLKQTNTDLKQKTNVIKTATSILQNKLRQMGI
jgi:hypothetical protein